MVRPLFFSVKELKENELRTFLNQDIQQYAQRTAKAETPTDILDLQINIDEDIDAILLAGAERINIVLRNKTHFFHKGGNNTNTKVPLVQQKRELLSQLLAHPLQNGQQ